MPEQTPQTVKPLDILDPMIAGLICAGGSVLLIAAAYLFQYVGEMQPCELCLWQRPPHFAVAVIGLFAAWAGSTRRFSPNVTRGAVALAGLVLAIGAGIAIYHAGVEWKFWAGFPSCVGGDPNVLSSANDLFASRPVRCDEAPWSLLGLSMAGWNALLSIALAGYAFASAWPKGSKMDGDVEQKGASA